MLQADSAELLSEWIAALHKSIGSAITEDRNSAKEFGAVCPLQRPNNFKKM